MSVIIPNWCLQEEGFSEFSEKKVVFELHLEV